MTSDLANARRTIAQDVERLRAAGRVRCLGAGCWGCCRGTLEVRAEEVTRIAAVMPPEAWERVRAPFGGDPETRICPLLDPTTKTCSVYAERPLICRSFTSAENPARCYPEYVGSAIVGHNMSPIQIAADAIISDGFPLELISTLQKHPDPRTP